MKTKTTMSKENEDLKRTIHIRDTTIEGLELATERAELRLERKVRELKEKGMSDSEDDIPAVIENSKKRRRSARVIESDVREVVPAGTKPKPRKRGRNMERIEEEDSDSQPVVEDRSLKRRRGNGKGRKL